MGELRGPFRTAAAIALVLMILASPALTGFHPVPFPVGTVCAAGEEELFTHAYEDPEGDVTDLDGDEPAGELADGAPDVDVVSVTSSYTEPEGPGGVIPGTGLREPVVTLTMTVAGIVADSSGHSYVFNVIADDESFMFYYRNGACVELLSGRPVLDVRGAGTETLAINVSEEDLGGPRDGFDVSAMTTLSSGGSGTDETVYDVAPDSGGGREGEPPVSLTDPTPGAAVSGATLVSGVSRARDLGITTVEWQVDSESDSGWEEAETTDGWSTFQFSWDTAGLDDGEHVVNVRAKNETTTFSSSESYWVDGDLYVNTPTMEMPAPRLGDEAEMSFYTATRILGIWVEAHFDYVSTLTHETEFESSDGPATCLSYALDGVETTELLGFAVTLDVEGTTLVRKDDLALVREELWANMTDETLGDVSVHSVTTYDPPLRELRFPISVGDQWTASSEVTTVMVTVQDGETSEDTYEGTRTVRTEALREERVSVGAGSFVCLVLRQEGASGEDEEAGVDHSLVWYNRTAAATVRQEDYDSDGELVNSGEMTDFVEGEGEPVVPDPDDGEEPPSFSAVIPNEMLLLLAVIALVAALAALVAARRKRRSSAIKAASRDAIGDGVAGPGDDDWLTCPNCSRDFDPSKARVKGEAGKLRCPHCGVEGRTG